MKSIKLVELFSGIGTFREAMENLGWKYESVDAVEYDKYAVKSYNAAFNDNIEIQDITKWDKNVVADIVVGGFPCQDISIAGKQAGIIEGETRSGLMFDQMRIVKKIMPKIVITENVKNILSKSHIGQFNLYLDFLEELGYVNDYRVINGKHYVPQSRERVFVVSIRKDIYKGYEFPDKTDIPMKASDILEPIVDKKFYYSEERTAKLIKKLEEEGLGKEIKLDCVGRIEMNGHDYLKRVYNENGLLPTFPTVCGGGHEPKVASCVASREYNGFKDLMPTFCARDYKDPKTTIIPIKDGDDVRYVIRRITPLEYSRGQGFSDEFFYKLQSVNSNTQLYKQFGNAIILPIAIDILKSLEPYFDEGEDNNRTENDNEELLLSGVSIESTIIQLEKLLKELKELKALVRK